MTVSGSLRADPVDDAKIKALQAKIDALERTVEKLIEVQKAASADAKAAKKQASQAEVHAQAAQKTATATDAQAKAVAGDLIKTKEKHGFLEKKEGNALTFYTPGGEITGYGQFDVSIDATTKNAGSLALNGATPPVGNFGWMPAISTNLSYLGVRGFQRLPNTSTRFVYQFEAGIDISAVPGNKQSNSNLSNQVNGALFSRNTYIGFANSEWGAVKIGKTDAPYKLSTAEFNPFSGMIGDYSVIMGNTGGDNRVEFGTRLSHAIWYESPSINGFNFNFLYSPGQNRATNDDNLASGESDCAGGNDPTSGGNPLVTCSDGAFGDAFSANLAYTNGPLYVTGAYELHRGVNRQSDIAGMYGLTPVIGPQNCSAIASAAGQALCTNDVANEWALKGGILYKFPSKTTVGFIFEHMQRDVSADLAFQNERTRNGTWLVVSQQLNEADSVHFGWAHAFKSPGDPGQHNTATIPTPDGGGTYAPNNNQADMITAAWKHRYSENLIWYLTAAATFNGPSAHYDLGAGGRSVTTDCHDAFNASGGLTSGPHCYAGTTLVGVSTGVQWRF